MTEGYQSLQVEGRITRQGNGPRAGVQSLESQLESKDRDGEVGRKRSYRMLQVIIGLSRLVGKK